MSAILHSNPNSIFTLHDFAMNMSTLANWSMFRRYLPYLPLFTYFFLPEALLPLHPRRSQARWSRTAVRLSLFAIKASFDCKSSSLFTLLLAVRPLIFRSVDYLLFLSLAVLQFISNSAISAVLPSPPNSSTCVPTGIY